MSAQMFNPSAALKGHPRHTLRRQRQLGGRKRFIAPSLGDTMYAGLAVIGWTATTALATAGLFVVLFIAAGNGTFEGFFEQVALLSTHYGQVDAAARAPFNHELSVAVAIVFLATGFFRRAALISIFKTGGSDGSR